MMMWALTNRWDAHAQVASCDVWSKPDVDASVQHLGGLPDLPPWNMPGPDRRATAVIIVGKSGMMRIQPLGVDEGTAADIQSGRRETHPIAECVAALNNVDLQRRMNNNESFEA
jgi:hypothetical protein